MELETIQRIEKLEKQVKNLTTELASFKEELAQTKRTNLNSQTGFYVCKDANQPDEYNF